jgi:hypothetical protein
MIDNDFKKIFNNPINHYLRKIAPRPYCMTISERVASIDVALAEVSKTSDALVASLEIREVADWFNVSCPELFRRFLHLRGRTPRPARFHYDLRLDELAALLRWASPSDDAPHDYLERIDAALARLKGNNK